MVDSALVTWLHKLEQIHPIEIELGLERVGFVANRLGLLNGGPYTFAIAGTNGKGSVASVLSAALTASGHRVGVYTSPHLISFNERVVVDSLPVTDAELVAAFRDIDRAREHLTLTFFEFATLAALLIFRQRKVDVQVLEVGLGGRLDAVNIIDANISIITNIGLDHTDFLGPNRESIAIEKAGIARRNRPCIVADPNPPKSLGTKLRDLGALRCELGKDWSLSDNQLITNTGKVFQIPKTEGLIAVNVATALQALAMCDLAVSWERSLEAASGLVLPGRLQRFQLNGKHLVLDVAHNRESVAYLVNSLKNSPVEGKTRALFGVMGDKPIHDMLLACTEVIDEWYLLDLHWHPRAADSASIKHYLADQAIADSGGFQSLWNSLSIRTQVDDRIVIFGSFHVVGYFMSKMDCG